MDRDRPLFAVNTPTASIRDALEITHGSFIICALQQKALWRVFTTTNCCFFQTRQPPCRLLHYISAASFAEQLLSAAAAAAAAAESILLDRTGAWTHGLWAHPSMCME